MRLNSCRVSLPRITTRRRLRNSSGRLCYSRAYIQAETGRTNDPVGQLENTIALRSYHFLAHLFPCRTLRQDSIGTLHGPPPLGHETGPKQSYNRLAHMPPMHYRNACHQVKRQKIINIEQPTVIRVCIRDNYFRPMAEAMSWYIG